MLKELTSIADKQDLLTDAISKSSKLAMLSVIVPTYNEAENVAELIARLSASLKGVEFEVLIVDDGSPDGTADLAESLAKTLGNVRVLRRPRKTGLASAVLDGVGLTEAGAIAVVDGALQHPPELLPHMCEKLAEGRSIVVASRYVEGGKVDGWGMRRRFVSKAATMLAHLLLRRTSKVRDPMSGYFVFRKQVIEGVPLNPTGYKILLEILAKGRIGPVAEVLYTFKPRLRGKTKLDFKEVWDYIRHVHRILADTSEYSRLVKFCVVGLSGVPINELSLWLLTDIVGLNYLAAGIVSTEFSILSNFVLNESWTSRDKRSGPLLRSLPKRLLSFNIARIASMALALAVLAMLTGILGIDYLVSNLFAISVAMIWNFLVSVHWIWV